MIQLNDLSKELTEVQNDELALIVGGDGYFPRNYAEPNVSNGIGSLKYGIGGTATSVGADTTGSFKIDTNLSSNTRIQAGYNINTGAGSASATVKSNDFTFGGSVNTGGGYSVGVGFFF